ncbi:ubiquitin carboxyl-terminal hydrolase 2-like isoform X2 [Asparagus officinalis]|uniref:ubiquitin carboxyl-terminal hydrolase 2-like isoform X2 n=1 Tax=Asparagus officinalis TaxID=4686 RepID=UPI00098E5BD1|nr:ubiquitin carboxyl-terminal hydrolase 2-like isoform X2 [Asparagus officinalis]
MGKKMKKKAPNPRKALHRPPAGPSRSVDRKDEVVVEHEGERGSCNHYSKCVDDLNQILSSVRSNSNSMVACEHCREEPVSRRGGKEKGKQQKKKGGARVSALKKESNFVWVCLDCNRYFCGGEVSVSEPYGHARRHSNQEHHMWAVRSDDPLISWCYSCKLSVPIEMPSEEMDGAPKLVVASENGVESAEIESSKGYVVRGLSNLGNTCFFNSVMQNLLATDMLRDCLMSLDQSLGPISMALKKLFVETSYIADSKNVLSPKALFGSICAKAPQFRGYQQQDSHELLLYLLDGLYAEEISASKLHDSSDELGKTDPSQRVTFVDTIFGGQISSTVCCTACGHTSVVDEPFLDLSLPVPSKKPPPKRGPPKKAPPPPPKRKPPLKDKNKGKRFREKVVSKGSNETQQSKEESSDVLLECSEAIFPQPKPEVAVDVKIEDDFTWMDFCEAPVTQCSDREQVIQSESSKDLNVSDTCREISCSNEVPSSCAQDSNVILLPYKEPGPIAEDTNVCSVEAPAEEEFDGFGDLFNEPEVTSAPKTENGTGEELDLTWWTGHSCESNYDEVDNTNAPVSINSCLALLTKPELLSDEHAWHCDRCSKNASNNAAADSTVIKVLENGKVASFSENLTSQDETSNGHTVEDYISQNSLNLIGGSDNKEIKNEESASLLGPDVLTKDEEVAASDDSSHYFSCQTSHENTPTQEKSLSQKADSCSVNYQDDSESEEVHSETVKVMRDATKRILINRLPPILTIHLKRFSQDARGRLTKLSGHVSFQETLDLRPYMNPRYNRL